MRSFFKDEDPFLTLSPMPAQHLLHKSNLVVNRKFHESQASQMSLVGKAGLATFKSSTCSWPSWLSVSVCDNRSKGCIWSTGYSLKIKDPRAVGQQLMTETWRRELKWRRGGVLFTGLLPRLAQPAFLPCRSICLGTASPTSLYSGKRPPSLARAPL